MNSNLNVIKTFLLIKWIFKKKEAEIFFLEKFKLAFFIIIIYYLIPACLRFLNP